MNQNRQTIQGVVVSKSRPFALPFHGGSLPLWVGVALPTEVLAAHVVVSKYGRLERSFSGLGEARPKAWFSGPPSDMRPCEPYRA